jgi:PII-like signaling protein
MPCVIIIVDWKFSIWQLVNSIDNQLNSQMIPMQGQNSGKQMSLAC